jgi:hypothetical protein
MDDAAIDLSLVHGILGTRLDSTAPFGLTFPERVSPFELSKGGRSFREIL